MQWRQGRPYGQDLRDKTFAAIGLMPNTVRAVSAHCHAADGDWLVKPAPPFIPGHEGTGIVAAVGAGVTNLEEGDPVGIAWLHDACGFCEYCITGWETLCEAQHNSGYGVNGSFAEYAIGAASDGSLPGVLR